MRTPTIRLQDCHVSRHHAMDTEFSLWLPPEVDEGDVLGIGRLCWDKVDQLEAQLSRFVEASDISRMNQMQAGEWLYVAEETHECLLKAMAGYEASAGLFDITIGRRIEVVKQGGVDPGGEGEGGWEIAPDRPAVRCHGVGRMVDLGGIGKGYALERVKQVLQEWGVDGGLLAAGASTLVAFGKDVWPVELVGQAGVLALTLSEQALSASGVEIQGRHILHPDGPVWVGGDEMERVWVVARDGVVAEVASTAMMLVGEDEVGMLMERMEAVEAAWYEKAGEIRRGYGREV